ncbi:hypothetical protein HaLaN_10012 [Haematococcus lacustris]|uniref:Uncharacterized protein n=1 Tax=Haematococcus lacustris TaxID=44745 RepID=A0A699Z4R6_HAELA|nr:hypothetical protein HaLaN_10012 [Haematococcus lacustris]
MTRVSAPLIPPIAWCEVANQLEVAGVPKLLTHISCSNSRGALAPMGCEADVKKSGRRHMHLAPHADCSTS